MAVDSSGALYVGQIGPILKISPGGTKTSPGGTVTTFANLGSPDGLAVDSAGNVFVAEVNQVFKISPSGVMTTFAGTGQYGDSGDGGPAINASFGFFSGIAFDSVGDLILADGTIRKITPDGIVHTVANATCCSSPDGSMLDGGSGSIGVDSAGNAYIALYLSSVVRKVTPTGIVTNVAGNPAADSVGDGGPAVDAQLSIPEAVAVDVSGMFISRITEIPAFGWCRPAARSRLSQATAPRASRAMADPLPAHNWEVPWAWQLTLRETCSSPST